MQPDPIEPMDPAVPVPAAPDPLRAIRRLLTAILLIMGVAALSLARDVVLPVVLAALAASTLSSPVRRLRRIGLPAPVAAPAIVLLVACVLGTLGFVLKGPVLSLVADAPRIGSALASRLQDLRPPLDAILSLTERSGLVSASDGQAQRVVVEHPPAFLGVATTGLLSVGSTLGVTLVLALAFLGAGPSLRDALTDTGSSRHVDRLLVVAVAVQREISRYLLTITIINLALGAVIAHGLWLLGLPDALLWGAVAALLNFMPYVGSIATTLLVAAVSLVTFDSLPHALLPPAFALVCYLIEGQFVSPAVVGRRLEINTPAILVAVLFWTWLWGFFGALMAVPLLVVAKAICTSFDELRPFGAFLSADPTPPSTERRQGIGRSRLPP